MTETDQEEQVLHSDSPEMGVAADPAQGSTIIVSKSSKHIAESEVESEDEEVKRNCMMGVSEYRDSDFDDTDMEDDDEEEEEEEQQPQNDLMETEAFSGEQKLVEFVAGGEMTKPEGTLYRPTPVMAKKQLATHTEEGHEEDTSSSSESEEEEEECLSDNARGASYSYMVNSNDELDVSSSSDEEDSENEEVDQVELAVINDEEAEVDAVATSFEEEEEDSSTDDEEEEDQVLENAAAEAAQADPGQSAVEEESAGEEHDDDDDEVLRVIELAVEEPTAVSPEGDSMDELLSDQDQAEPEDEDFSALIGACVDDDKWTWSKQKRVLSSNTLAALNREAGRGAEEPKRMRSYSYPPTIMAEPPSMPELSLGMAAFETTPFVPRQSVIREASPTMSSDEEEDRMLSEELEESTRDSGGDNSPIPLLTPPSSPRREDDVEWPSNLVVDSALMNTVTEIRPLSPASLQSLEVNEEQRLKDVEASTLTPLLRSICVGMR